MADLIRWEDNGYGGFLGYAGTLEDSWLFQVWKTDHHDPRTGWLLSATLPGCIEGTPENAAEPGPLKVRAEELLREFASSLGAVFPEAYLHELVFTDRDARPATWRTRCGRTDVPLERTMSPQPGSYYEVTCPACLRVAGLEALLDEILSTYVRSMAANASARSLVPGSRLATWRAVRNAAATGEPA